MNLVSASAGSMIAALYAVCNKGTDLNKIALSLDEASITDYALPFSSKFGGMIKGDALQATINRLLKNQTIENMATTLGIVATDLKTGTGVLFRREDTGQAVRASCGVPGVSNRPPSMVMSTLMAAWYLRYQFFTLSKWVLIL